MCNCPIIGYRHPHELTKNGKQKIIFKEPYANAPKLELPCGRCIACRLEKTRQWGMRAEHEAKFHDENCFLTLTYNPENLPPLFDDEGVASVQKRPLQLFIKRLRKSIPHIRIKYIASGELGDNCDNPHYHICIFGYMPPDSELLYKRDNNNYYISKNISLLWPYGFHTITDLNFQTARYTAKYAIKKQLGKEEKTLPAEFFVCSQGIAQAHVNKYAQDMATKGQTFANNNPCSLPRYYKNKIKDTQYKNKLENTLNNLKNKIQTKNKKYSLIQKEDLKYNNEIIKRKQMTKQTEVAYIQQHTENLLDNK